MFCSFENTVTISESLVCVCVLQGCLGGLCGGKKADDAGAETARNAALALTKSSPPEELGTELQKMIRACPRLPTLADCARELVQHGCPVDARCGPCSQDSSFFGPWQGPLLPF